MSVISEKDFYEKIKEIKKIKKNIEDIESKRNKEGKEIFKQLLEVNNKYKTKINELKNLKRSYVKTITKNWDSFIKGKQFDFEDEKVVKVIRYDFKVDNKIDTVKLLLLMKNMDPIEFSKPKLRQLIKIGSIPEEYIKKIDQSFIKFMKS